MNDDQKPAGPPPGTTLFAWVKSALRDAISRGEYSPDQAFITQREIVERFGVSTTTAVRALNDLVAEGLVVRHRGRGTFVAERPQETARAGRSGTSAGLRTVAFVSPNAVDAHQIAVQTGIGSECTALGHRLVVKTTPDVDAEAAVLRSAVEEGAEGVIAYVRDRSRAAATIEELRRGGVPVVLVDRYFPSMPTDAVIFDDFAIGYEVTTAVLDRGHRALAVLWGEEDVTSVRDRLSGHYRALRDRGLPELPERSALRNYMLLSPDRRYERLRALIESPIGLTAIIGGNAHMMTLAASDLLAFADGFPGSVELANMDELGPYEVSPLAVVSATLPAHEMGATAMRVLHERLAGASHPTRHIVLPGRVHVVSPDRNTLSVAGTQSAGGPRRR